MSKDYFWGIKPLFVVYLEVPIVRQDSEEPIVVELFQYVGGVLAVEHSIDRPEVDSDLRPLGLLVGQCRMQPGPFCSTVCTQFEAVSIRNDNPFLRELQIRFGL